MQVLLIEDDTLLCELLRDSLVEAGFEVDAAYNGKQALALYHRQRYEVIVLDLVLPDMPGLSVLALIREIQAEPPPRVIVSSGRNDKAARKGAAEFGVDYYLTKPFEIEHLVVRVRELAQRGGQPPAPPQAEEGSACWK